MLSLAGAPCSKGMWDVAKQIIHKLVDDLDGGDADETVKFALDGVQYEIDLSERQRRLNCATYSRRTSAPAPRWVAVVWCRRAGRPRSWRRHRRPGAEQGDPGVGQEGRQGHLRPGSDPAGDRRRVPREALIRSAVGGQGPPRATRRRAGASSGPASPYPRPVRSDSGGPGSWVGKFPGPTGVVHSQWSSCPQPVDSPPQGLGAALVAGAEPPFRGLRRPSGAGNWLPSRQSDFALRVATGVPEHLLSADG